MHYIEQITKKFKSKDYSMDYSQGTPVPWLFFDDFLPEELLKKVQAEINQIPKYMWTHFTRNGSFMEECNKLHDYCPTIRDLTLNLNSSEFISWLEELTGINKVIPDPHLIGAGLMRCYTGHSLKLHTDFNWNEE